MRIRFLATLGFLALIVAASAFGQQRLKADIPFDFQVGKVVLPAGHYTIERGYRNAENALFLDCSDCKTGGGGVAVVANRIQVEGDPKAKLVFHRYRSTYFLFQIISDAWGNELRRSKAERDIARNIPNSEAGQVMLALR